MTLSSPKMAACQGYKCEFLDSVPDDLYCKKCTLVALKLTITNCCGESFCQACITSIQDNKEPCPECGATEFTTFEQIKSQKRINNLQVYCSMKERGCGWSGTLEQLDTHLDPHLDNCQYVDTECPLNCLKTIPKNNLDDHVAQHCVKRAYVCRYCSFKATYEEVVDTHLPQCKYVPLDCPNRCGATFERDFLEDHMKMCRLEEVECELRGVGCGGRFLREDKEEHARQNSQKHLTLTASLAMETKEQLQQKLLELDQRHKEEEKKLKKKIEEQEDKVEQQEKKLKKQEERLEKQEEKLEKQEEGLEKQEERLEKQEERLEKQEEKLFEIEQKLREILVKQLQKLNEAVFFNQQFEIRNFSLQNPQQSSWTSSVKHTHTNGYNFNIMMNNNKTNGHDHCVYLVFALVGEFDDNLKWPARATFTIELINQRGGENISNSETVEWIRPTHPIYIAMIDLKPSPNHFVNNNTLSFICKVDLV